MLAFLSSFVLNSCSDPFVIPVVQGEPALDIQASQSLETAAFLCRYSRGAFPNWILWPAFQDLLVPDEQTAIQEVTGRLLEQVPYRYQAKYIAVRTFIARNTTCTPVITDGSSPVQGSDSGLVAFEFDQTYPVVPNIPELHFDDSTPQETQIEAWINAFTKAWKGELREKKIQITLESDQTGQYHLFSNLRESYAIPMAERDFWVAFDQFEFENAAEKLAIICTRDTHLCRQLSPIFYSGWSWQKNSNDIFMQEVNTTFKSMTNIAMTANSSYTAVEFELENHGNHTFSQIIFRTDEITAQQCVLQSERSKRKDHPLVLEPRQKVKAWCALNGQTRPWTQSTYWLSDIQ